MEKTKRDSKKEEKEATARALNVPVSRKIAVAICDMIRNKNPKYSIEKLELVLKKKYAVPMKGEIPHRKGEIMSGRYPQNASFEFIKLLKNLIANAEVKNMDTKSLVVYFASANKAGTAYHPGRVSGGRRLFKRTHITLKAKENKK